MKPLPAPGISVSTEAERIGQCHTQAIHGLKGSVLEGENRLKKLRERKKGAKKAS